MPLALFFGFEMLMRQVQNGIERTGVLKSLADLQAELEAKRREAETARQQWAAEVQHHASERKELEAALTDLAARRQALTAEIATLRRQAETVEYTKISEETRQRALTILAERSDISGSELGRLLGKSDSMGRKLRRELLPLVSGNGHHPRSE
jgi:septal ring factor EnvC (AmiA/AmiB activator)